MPKPFYKLSISDFEALVESFNFTRRIDAVHMHHTWRPNHSQDRGLASIEAMWRFHTQDNGWSDIAQHITIDKQGGIWTGRNWNIPPASASGYNGNARRGPFMFEMIGDFDKNKDPFGGEQKVAVIRVLATILKKFSLPVSALRFHHHMTDQKTCPGSAIDYDEFCQEVAAALKADSSPATPKKRGAAATVEEARWNMDEPVEVDLSAPEFLADHLHFAAAAFTARSGGSGGVVDAAAHVINLTDGKLSQGGYMTTSEASLEALFKTHLALALEEAKSAGQPLRLMFFAHGGLNKEKGAVETALSRVDWWKSNGVYPIFFVWETGLMETLSQMLQQKMGELWGWATREPGRRGLGDFVADKFTDPAVEKAARSIGGVPIWGAMKRSAARAAEPQTGGAWLTAKHVRDFLKTAKDYPVELHAIGHSAGSIFHAHFLAALREALGTNGPSIKTLHHLAPAIRVDLFKEKVLPLLGKGIDHLTLYTMTDEKERDDTCMGVYRKSLLYLIHHGLEPEARCPLVGLEQSVRGDPTLRNLFEPVAPGVAEVIWSPTQGGPRYSSRSLKHGDFDDDPATMNSVCRRLLGRNDIVEYNVTRRGGGEAAFETDDTLEDAALGILVRHARRTAPQGGATTPAAPIPQLEAAGPAVLKHGNRRALCIGINAYPDSKDRLQGCVGDAEQWAAFFKKNGFGIVQLLDAQAGYEALLSGFRDLIASAKQGDVIAIQYSGHGSQVKDLDVHDGIYEEDDWMDEAVCNHDFRTGKIVLDDELAELLLAVPQGVNFNLFMDCCHSGTNTKVAIGRDVPQAPAEAVKRYAHAGAELNDAHAAFRQTHPTKRHVRKAGHDIYADAKDVLFAAALPHQFAYEIGGGGVFTAAAMRVLERANGHGLTNAEFDAAVRASFPPQFRAVQESRLYGSDENKQRPFLGGL